MPLNESQQQFVNDVTATLKEYRESGAKVSFDIRSGKPRKDITAAGTFYKNAATATEYLLHFIDQLTKENHELRLHLSDSRTAEQADLMAQNAVLTGENERLYKELGEANAEIDRLKMYTNVVSVEALIGEAINMISVIDGMKEEHDTCLLCGLADGHESDCTVKTLNEAIDAMGPEVPDVH